MAGAPAPQAQGVTPPMGSPAAQKVPNVGEQAGGRQIVALSLGLLHKALGAFQPDDDAFKDISQAIIKLMKHAKPDPDTMKTGKLPQMNQAGAPPGPMPQMAGGAQGAMMPRGPVPMGA
jgi:hypothetical protein